MIHAIALYHPQSKDLLSKTIFNTKYVRHSKISCGTSKVDNVDFSEANDFYPTYASWNSVLFETSVILTIWEHADQLIGGDDVAIIHSDIALHFKPAETWKQINKWIRENPKRSVGLTVPSSYSHAWEDWLIPKSALFVPKFDPMKLHSFDNGIFVWDYIKTYDPDIYQWAMDTQPRLIYSHQFACSRATFDYLGAKLFEVVHRLRLQDTGFWIPHMFERLIALYLARYGGDPILSTCFWHYSSSGVFGPGELNLYGPRPRRYYRVLTRWNQGTQPCISAKNAASTAS